MTKKPSLYVVERKEVVILVVLFVLVTILSFTMGVKYGETSGKKQALDEKAAIEEVAEAKTEAAGHLGSAPTETSAHSAAEPAPAASDAHGDGAHAAPEAKPAGHGEEGAAKPALATPSPAVSPPAQASVPNKGADSAAESADAYLLNALKEAGIESARRGAAVDESASAEKGLPEEVKAKPSASAAPSDDSWVIQVASYNTEQEAKRHAERLRARSLEPLIFSGMDSQNGKWYRVALGKYADREKAGQIARNYKSKGWIGSGSFVRRAP
jgi:hypothetical protein